ncbi:MAG: hypothetical protein KF784_03385 [Fimbriimonadaceae bacterium]|nr:hypothetical protein [Fimbriimonadaceae bacterium]
MLVAAIAVAILGLPTPAQDTLPLTKGETWVSTVTEEFLDSETGELEQSFTYRVEKKVLERLKGSFAIESKRTMTGNKIGEVDVPMPPGLEPLIEQYTVDPYGLRTKLVEGGRQQQEQRLNQLVDFLCPDRFGPNASSAFKRTIEEADTPKVTRLEFSAGVWDKEKKTFRCAVAMSDSGWAKGIEAKGEAVFPEDSCIPNSITMSAKGVEMPGGSGDTYTLRVKLVRVVSSE